MRLTKRQILGLTMLLAVTLGSAVASAGDGCHRVNANIKGFGAFIEDPGQCNGYDFCQSVKIRGTLNGTWWLYGYYSGIELVAGDSALVYALDGIFKTQKGDLYVSEREIVHLQAADGDGFNAVVLSGTGAYEGASGWLTGYATFGEVGGKIAGEICWNGN